MLKKILFGVACVTTLLFYHTFTVENATITAAELYNAKNSKYETGILAIQKEATQVASDKNQVQQLEMQVAQLRRAIEKLDRHKKELTNRLPDVTRTINGLELQLDSKITQIKQQKERIQREELEVIIGPYRSAGPYQTGPFGYKLQNAMQWDQEQVRLQHSLRSYPKDVVLFRTNDATERFLTQVVAMGTSLLRRGTYIHVVYYGNNQQDIDRLRFAAKAVVAAVHVVDPNTILDSVLSVQDFVEVSKTLCKMNQYTDIASSCSSETFELTTGMIWHHHRYLLDVSFLLHYGRLGEDSNMLVLDSNLQYFGNIAYFLDQFTEIGVDVVVATGNKDEYGMRSTTNKNDVWDAVGKWVKPENVFRSLSEFKIMSSRFAGMFVTTTTVLQYIASDELIVGTLCSVFHEVCEAQVLDDVAPKYRVAIEDEELVVHGALDCLRLVTSRAWDACRRMNRGVRVPEVGEVCPTAVNVFVKRSPVPYDLNETVLLDWLNIENGCNATYDGRWKRYGPPAVLYYDPNLLDVALNYTNYTVHASEPTTISEELRHTLPHGMQQVHGYSKDWWNEIHLNMSGAYNVWDREAIDLQFARISKPKTIFLVRTHLVTQRIITSFKHIAMSMLRYGGHLHVSYQGSSLAQYQYLRDQLRSLNVAVHQFRSDFVYEMATRFDAMMKVVRAGKAQRGRYKMFSKFAKNGGIFKPNSTNMILWLFAFLPDLAFLGKFGPIPECATFWNLEYDVEFLGDISRMIHQTAQADKVNGVIDFVAPAESQVTYQQRPTVRNWLFWGFCHPFIQEKDQWRSLGSTKRLSAQFAAYMVELVLDKGWWCVDELMFLSACKNKSGCTDKMMNTKFPYMPDDHFYRVSAYPDVEASWNMFRNPSNVNKLVHKVVHPFRLDEHNLLKATYVLN